MVASKRKPNKQYEFINVDFSYNQRKHYGLWVDKAVMDLEKLIGEIADNGWKITFSYDVHREAYIGSISCKADDKRFGNKIFMIRHVDLEKVVRLCSYYFVEVLMSTDSPDIPDDTQDW